MLIAGCRNIVYPIFLIWKEVTVTARCSKHRLHLHMKRGPPRHPKLQTCLRHRPSEGQRNYKHRSRLEKSTTNSLSFYRQLQKGGNSPPNANESETVRDGSWVSSGSWGWPHDQSHMPRSLSTQLSGRRWPAGLCEPGCGPHARSPVPSPTCGRWAPNHVTERVTVYLVGV